MATTGLSCTAIVYVGLLCHLFILDHTIGYDPCKDDTVPVLHSLYRRLTWYNLSSSDLPLCDNFLNEGWYRVKEFHIATTPPSHCGTSYIWWSNDTLPGIGEVGKIQNKTVCLKTDASNCELVESVRMINCEGHFVYYLKPTSGCPEAYCLDMDGPKPTGDVSAPSVSLHPTIYVEREIEKLMPPFNNKLLFYCNFTTNKDSNLLYTVEWYKGHNTLGSLLYESEPTKFTTEDDFKMKTALTEDRMDTIGIHLVCSVMARKEKYGIPSTPSTSQPFFAGIEVINKTAVHISSENDKPTIHIRSTIPFACRAGDDNCRLDINVYIPSADDCRLPNAGIQDSSKCGVQIPKKEWDQPQLLTIVLKESYGVISTDPVIMDVYLKTIYRFTSHKIFGNHILPDRVQVHVSSIKKDLLNNKFCHAICDPHMKTFDQLLYENQREGTFVLYNNTDYPAEVQIKTKSCYRNNNKPYCPCGVAVRAGRDVFVVNKCETPYIVRMVQCLDGVLRGKITEEGKSFTVNLPTGTRVNIEYQPSFESYGVSYNIIIQPSLTDYRHTEGLCGTFDGDQNNDLLKRDGSRELAHINNRSDDPSNFNNDWKVKTGQDLFEMTSLTNLPEWKKETYICNCTPDSQGYSVTTKASCEADRRNTCKRDNLRYARAAECGVFRKRSIDDVHEEYESFDVDQFDVQEMPRMIYRRSVPVPVNYTESIARQACRDHLNSSIVFRKCSHLPNFDPTSYIESCIMDAMISNSMDWADSHLETAKTNCISLVDLNQPIPKEALRQFSSLSNSSSPKNASSGSDNYTTTKRTTDHTTDTTDISNIYNAELFEELEALSCPLDCSGHGLCSNGTCSCHKGYGDVDCSVDLSQPPITFGIPDRGICDLQKRPCRKTSVLGQHFIESQSLICRTINYQILQNGTKLSSDNQTQKAELISDSEVECSLPQGRDRREVDASTGDSISIARGYQISVSNDGKLFSQESTLLIFDSSCMNCTKAGSNFQCIIQSGFCMMDGRCYRQSEKFDCQICEATAVGSFRWTKSPDCQDMLKPVTHEESNLWIIGAVLGPIGLIALLGAIIISVKHFTRLNKVSVSQELTDSVVNLK